MRKMLYTRDSECIQPIRELIEVQKHRTLVMWVFDCAPRVLSIFEKEYPEETRPREAIETAKAWARGEVKMPAAKAAILAADKAATEAEACPAAQAAACAVGHAAATVHVETHALGLVCYGLTAFVYAAESESADDVVVRECEWFLDRLRFWAINIERIETTWAPFLLRDDVPNKEQLLRQKQTTASRKSGGIA